MILNVMLFIGLQLTGFIITADAMMCISKENSTMKLTCPGPNDPIDYTRCCWNSSAPLCCQLLSSVDLSHQKNVMIAGITVISACIIISILIIVCCFWSRCPLFKMCRVNYTHSEILSYSKEEEALRMPPEGVDGCTHYSPCHVIIKPVQDI